MSRNVEASWLGKHSISGGAPVHRSCLQRSAARGAGVVEALGPEVTDFQVGDRVVFLGNSYATHAAVSARLLIRVPDQISLELAAGMNQGFLAYVFTHFAYPVKPGEWCLIQAAAGGMGLLLCQMAKIRQGRVIGVTSSDGKAHFVREADADEVIISQRADIAKEALRYGMDVCPSELIARIRLRMLPRHTLRSNNGRSAAESCYCPWWCEQRSVPHPSRFCLGRLVDRNRSDT